MARVTYVKKAQQRYKTVPVYEADGVTPKLVPVLNSRTGEQKVTKAGKLVVRRITQEDKAQPLALHKCERCQKDIELGTPYQHVTPKSSAYGGRTRYRCGTCPSWNVWELSNSLSARIAQLQSEHDRTVSQVDSEDDVTGYLSEAAEAIRELATEKQEAADNLEGGFGHETEQSAGLAEIADQLNQWADDVEGAYVPERPEPDEDDEAADGPSDEALEEWAGQCTDLISEKLSEAPC